MKPAIGDTAPLFSLPTDNSGSFSLEAQKGKWVVVYFYPKDDTPGCTTQACAFRDNLPRFDTNNAVVVGISKDDEQSHARFRGKFSLTFPLAADTDGTVCEQYGVWVEKMNYGKKYMGIERTTFLIDDKGIVRQVWNKVKVEGHAEKVLEVLQQHSQKNAA